MPDCGNKVIRESLNDFVSTNSVYLGNVYQTTSGDILVVDYTSLPDVGWGYVIGTFTGKAVFGDVSAGDLVSETIVTADGEVGSFIGLYSDLMKLQWIVFIRTMTPNTVINLTTCSMQVNSNQLLISGVSNLSILSFPSFIL